MPASMLTARQAQQDVWNGQALVLGLAWASSAHVAAPDGSIMLHSVGAASGCSPPWLVTIVALSWQVLAGGRGGRGPLDGPMQMNCYCSGTHTCMCRQVWCSRLQTTACLHADALASSALVHVALMRVTRTTQAHCLLPVRHHWIPLEGCSGLASALSGVTRNRQ